MTTMCRAGSRAAWSRLVRSPAAGAVARALRGRVALRVQRADHWAYDMTFMLYGTFFMLGAAFTLQRKRPCAHRLVLRPLVAAAPGAGRPGCYLLMSAALRRRVACSSAGATSVKAYVTNETFVRARGSRSPGPSSWRCRSPAAAADPGLQRVPEVLHCLHAACAQWRVAGPARPRGGAGMSNELLGLVALGVLFAVIFIGFPIAFTLGAVALATGFIALGPVVFDLAVLQTYSVMKDTVLAAIPFFLFMGFLLEQSRHHRAPVQRHPATAGRRARLALPGGADHRDDLRRGHRHRRLVGHAARCDGRPVDDQERLRPEDVSAGAITAGGTLGILIPPSVMLIVMGPVVGVPATDLFAAAVLPGLLLSAHLHRLDLLRCWLNPSLGPALPDGDAAESLGPVIRDLAARRAAGGRRHPVHARRDPGRHRHADRCRRGRLLQRPSC